MNAPFFALNKYHSSLSTMGMVNIFLIFKDVLKEQRDTPSFFEKTKPCPISQNIKSEL